MRNKVAAGVLATIAAISSQPVHAAVVATFERFGDADELVFTLNGSLDLSGATVIGTDPDPFIRFGFGIGFEFADFPAESASVTYTLDGDYVPIGQSDTAFATTSSDVGVSFGVAPNRFSSGINGLILSQDYVSGTPLSASYTFDYNFTGSGDELFDTSTVYRLPNDTITVASRNVTPVPVPASLPLLLGALLLAGALQARSRG